MRSGNHQHGARLLERRIIDPGGRLVSGKEKFVLVAQNRKSNQNSLHISQKDIRAVQLGKSALSCGIEFLLKHAGFPIPEKIIFAGAFGSHLDRNDLIRLGMIPKIDHKTIESAGNAAGSGVVMTLCDSRFINAAERTAAMIETIDMALDPAFQESFIKHLQFPEQCP